MTAVTATAGRAAGTVLAKAFQQGGRIRLGGREERRIVYAQVQVCAIRVYESFDDLARLGFRPFNGRSELKRLAFLELRAFQEAAAELLLVGNARPAELAMELFAAAMAVDPNVPPGHERNRGVSEAFGQALDAFIVACRDDLWYLPQWWQVWRPAWWGVRWASLKARRSAKRELRTGGQSPAA